MHTQIPLVMAAAMGIAIVTYIIDLLLVARYMKHAAQIPASDPQRKNSLASLLGTVRSAVAWGTLMGWITFLLCLMLWLFGTTAQQTVIMNIVGIMACGLLLSALLCHLVCSTSLSSMKGDSEQPTFVRAARALPNRLLALSLIELFLYLFLTY